MNWAWLRSDVVVALHREQLAEHGGGDGVRDPGLLESALARPENLDAYGEPNIFDLAAAYSFGIIRNHPFVDGNKRTGFITGVVFLEINGYNFCAPEEEVVSKTLAFAAGEVSEEEYAQWLTGNSKKK